MAFFAVIALAALASEPKQCQMRLRRQGRVPVPQTVTLIELGGFLRLQKATTVAEARGAAQNFPLVGPLMGLGGLLLIVAGSALVTVSGLGWSPAWIGLTAAVFVILSVSGPLVNGRRCKRILTLACVGADGPITPELERARNDGLLTYSLFLSACELIAGLFMMTVKPDPFVCIVAVMSAALVPIVPARNYSMLK